MKNFGFPTGFTLDAEDPSILACKQEYKAIMQAAGGSEIIVGKAAITCIYCGQADLHWSHVTHFRPGSITKTGWRLAELGHVHECEEYWNHKHGRGNSHAAVS